MPIQELTPEEKEMLKVLGARIRARRRALGFGSIEKFVADKDVNRVQYWRYEVGENMKLINLVKVAYALEIPLDELVKGIFDK